MLADQFLCPSTELPLALARWRRSRHAAAVHRLRRSRPRPRQPSSKRVDRLDAVDALVLRLAYGAAHRMELQLAIEIARKQWLDLFRGRQWVKPGVVGGGVEDHRLAVVQLPHRLAGTHGYDRAARDVELLVVSPKPGAGERPVIREEDVPRVLALVARAHGPFVEAIGRDQAT